MLSAVLAAGGTAALVTGPLSSTPSTPAASGAPGAVTAAAGSTPAPTVSAEDLPDVVAAVRDSVVTITSQGFSSRGFAQIPSTGVGSGIVLTADGYILTNRHVVAGSQSLTVELADGEQFPATIVKQSDDKDLALIKISATGLKPAVIGDSASLQVGQTVIAIGSPLGHVHRDRDQGDPVGDRPDHHGPGRGDAPADDADRPAPDRCGDQSRATAAVRCSTPRVAWSASTRRSRPTPRASASRSRSQDAASLIAQATGASVS